MLKKLLNDYEAVTSAKLEHICEAVGAKVFAKVRLADVLPIDNSGITDREFRFAMKSHFDFVVSGADHRPLFAVEYDGPYHLDIAQQERDALKDSLCARFDCPLLRVDSQYLQTKYRGFDLLSWFVEVWFWGRALVGAQSEGLFPWNEPFDACAIISSSGREGLFPFHISRSSLANIREAHSEGRLYDWSPATIVGVDARGYYNAFSWILVTPTTAVHARARMRSQQFDVHPSDVLEDLAICDLWIRCDEVLAGKRQADEVHNVEAIIEEFHKSNAVLMQSSLGTVRG